DGEHERADQIDTFPCPVYLSDPFHAGRRGPRAVASTREIERMAVVSEIHHLDRHVGETVTVRGGVQTTRTHGRVAFLVVRDGTGIVQGVILQKEVPEEVWSTFHSLTLETSVAVTGEVRADARAPGGHELIVREIRVVGASEDYPIQPKEHGVDFLLDHRHLWLRSRQQRAILRVRNELEMATMDFYYERGFVRIDTPSPPPTTSTSPSPPRSTAWRTRARTRDRRSRR